MEINLEEYKSIDSQLFVFKTLSNEITEILNSIGDKGFFNDEAITKEKAIIKLKNEINIINKFLYNIEQLNN